MDDKTSTRPKRRRRILLWGLIALVGLCLAGAFLSALSNLTLPEHVETGAQLPAVDKARLAETMQLKEELSNQVWPGLAEAEIPILIWNRDYSFLIGVDESPAGWLEVAGDTFQGRPYFQQLSDDPQNFAVQVGEAWVASMGSKLEADLFVREMIQETVPPPLSQIIPYRLLIQPSEVQMSAVLHEAFHVFQRSQTQARLEDAELAYREDGRYWAVDPEMGEAWVEEIDMLAQALAATSDEQAADLVAQYLDRRRERRLSHNLSPALVDYERRLEWLEGLAKYVELEFWRQAAETQAYQPLLTTAEDSDFDEYSGFEGRWSQEIGQMKRQAGQEGDVRFYYTGMAQATLLDRLLPDWKEQVLEEGIWLEDLLGRAVEAAR
jgi:hypothetical protein